MSIDYRHCCDNCGKNMNDDGTPIYCEDCFNELLDKIEELKEEIVNLTSENERLENELSSLK